MKGGENMEKVKETTPTDDLVKFVNDQRDTSRLYSRLLALYESKSMINKELQKKIDATEKELLAKGEKLDL
tara:strand:- start:485 stop:697 length:213 start_codon:yes stop_codon:yes gene_type:complete